MPLLDCPVCGNEIVVPRKVSMFKCKFCKQWVRIKVSKCKGRRVVELEDIKWLESQ